MKRIATAILTIVILLGVAAIANALIVSENTDDSASGPELYNLNQVAEHATPTDCWTVIEGSVYDISEYTADHPGGEVIEMACGKDATSDFNDRLGEGPHSAFAKSVLMRYKIGELSN